MVDPYDLSPSPSNGGRPSLPKKNRSIRLIPEDRIVIKFSLSVIDGEIIQFGWIQATADGINPPGGILRRYDTDAISLTDMYKAALPSASEDDEMREMEWVMSSFDTRGLNGGRHSRGNVILAGNWALAGTPYLMSQYSQQAADEIARLRALPVSLRSAPASPQLTDFPTTPQVSDGSASPQSSAGAASLQVFAGSASPQLSAVPEVPADNSASIDLST